MRQNRITTGWQTIETMVTGILFQEETPTGQTESYFGNANVTQPEGLAAKQKKATNTLP